MDYLKYFKSSRYELGKCDCWTFLQEVFKNEHNIILPDVPIFDDPANESRLKANIKHIKVDKAKLGCFVFVKTKNLNHVGYALSETKYMHKTSHTGVIVSDIPKTAEIFEVIK